MYPRQGAAGADVPEEMVLWTGRDLLDLERLGVCRRTGQADEEEGAARRDAREAISAGDKTMSAHVRAFHFFRWETRSAAVATAENR